MNNDLEFSSLMIPIDNKVKGLLRFSIEQKIKLLELKVELHRLMFDLNDVKLVNTIMKGIIERCDLNPLNNDSIFSSINSKIIRKFNYNYYQLEDLSMKFKFINEHKDLNEEIDFPGEIFECKMKLFVRDIKRMQRFIDSFLFNYPIILDTLRFVDKRTTSLQPAAENESLFNDPPKTAAEKENNIIENTERTLIDEILEFLIISPQLLSFLIHLILNYFRFFNLSHTEKTENQLLVFFNSILSSELYVNKAYLLGLLKSLENVSLNTINLHTKNLVKFQFNYYDKLTNIELSSCNYILFFFCIRHLLETHKNWLYQNLEEVFCKPKNQIKILNKYISKISGLPIEYHYCDKEEDQTNIKLVSEKYQYMKHIDQEQFVNFVLNDLDNQNTNLPEIHIGIKNILDLDSLLQNKETDNEFIHRTDKTQIQTLLSYKPKEDEKIITNAFQLFLKYIENPVVLVTERDKVRQIPNNVINCFEKLKSILNDNNFKKENINTQYYYEQLMTVLPEDFQFPNTLYIIYQIIIPYMYYFYSIKLYEDVFLTTYKI